MKHPDKEQEKEYCPVTAVADLLSDTWTMRIIHGLIDTEGMRFCELERSLLGISTRTLTIKLRVLENRAIIEKTDRGYRMTNVGKKLKPVIRAMERFGRDNLQTR